MPITAQRILVPATGHPGDGNILHRHPADSGVWVWHPQVAIDATAVLRFSLEVESAGDEDVILHVSADQRYQLRIDGVEIGYGPDRGDLQHWAVASYAIHLPRGRHRIEALVWWLAKGAPAAQMTERGGFLLVAEDAKRFATGVAPWQVERIEHAFALDEAGTANHCGYAGWAFIIDGAALAAPRDATTAVPVVGAVRANPYGEQRPGLRLEPSILPEQTRSILPPGRVRAVWRGDPGAAIVEGGADCAQWQALLEGKPVQIAAKDRVHVLIDLGTYECFYPLCTLSQGTGAELTFTWAEALFDVPHVSALTRSTGKGQRDAVAGKVMHGVRDTLRAGGARSQAFPSLWWRAGRFVQITVTTAAEALTIERFAALATRYPLDEDASFRCDDANITGIWPLLVRGLQMSAHETWVDCPYYEQLMYVGDTRTEALTAYTLSRDDRLSRRCLELFDWSRWSTGWVAERYPSVPFQASGTYALLWPLCVHDHWLWRGDAAFTRTRLTGVRQLMEAALEHLREDGRCGALPGWSFVDWVKGWQTGMGPGVAEGDSSILDLHLILALQAAADLEDAVGEALCAQRWRAHARRAGEATVARFWNEERGMLADAVGCTVFSEHAQCLALLAGILDPKRAARCQEAWLTANDLARATIYFSYYPLEVLARAGRGDEIIRRMEFWRGLQAQGFTTTVEAPEPARSDCHGWGAHPLHHLLASIAGIRPLEAGLRRVQVAPQPGPLQTITASLPHPQGGQVEVDLARAGADLVGSIVLPPGITGVYRWAGKTQDLVSGKNRIGASAAQQR